MVEKVAPQIRLVWLQLKNPGNYSKMELSIYLKDFRFYQMFKEGTESNDALTVRANFMKFAGELHVECTERWKIN